MLVLAVATGLALLTIHWYTTPSAADDLGGALADVENDPSFTSAGGGTEFDEGAVLDVDAFTPGATIRVNGDSVGITPMRVRLLRTGEQWVVIQQGGETLLDTTVWVWANDVAELSGGTPLSSGTTDQREAEVAVRVPPTTSSAASNAGTIRVESAPAGAAVLLNGRRVGATPFTIESLAPGRYTLVVQRAGYETVRRRVTVRPGTRYEADLALRADAPPVTPPEPPAAQEEPSPPPRPESDAPVQLPAAATMGTVEVRVEPRGQIEINGRVRMLETDALYRTDLPPGTHRVRVSHPTLGSQERVVVVDRGVTYRLTFTLRGGS